jgi:hypothetical protein
MRTEFANRVRKRCWKKSYTMRNKKAYSSPNIIRRIKLRKVRWVGFVARMWGKKNAYGVLVGKS